MDDHPTYTPPPAPQITEQTSENEEAGDTKRTLNSQDRPLSDLALNHAQGD